jgi:hypothetical protein
VAWPAAAAVATKVTATPIEASSRVGALLMMSLANEATSLCERTTYPLIDIMATAKRTVRLF